MFPHRSSSSSLPSHLTPSPFQAMHVPLTVCRAQERINDPFAINRTGLGYPWDQNHSINPQYYPSVILLLYSVAILTVLPWIRLSYLSIYDRIARQWSKAIWTRLATFRGHGRKGGPIKGLILFLTWFSKSCFDMDFIAVSKLMRHYINTFKSLPIYIVCECC